MVVDAGGVGSAFACALAHSGLSDEIVWCNQHSGLTVSTVLKGEYGQSGVNVSVPWVLAQQGIERVFEVGLPPEEQSALSRSARVLRDAIASLDRPV